jgi:hypothetical protein
MPEVRGALMQRATRPLRSRFLNGFEMLPDVHRDGDLFVLDLDSVSVVEWHAPIEWMKDTPPPPGTPIVRSDDGAVWTVVKQPNISWVQTLEPVALLLPLALFE